MRSGPHHNNVGPVHPCRVFGVQQNLINLTEGRGIGLHQGEIGAPLEHPRYGIECRVAYQQNAASDRFCHCLFNNLIHYRSSSNGRVFVDRNFSIDCDSATSGLDQSVGNHLRLGDSEHRDTVEAPFDQLILGKH